MKKTLCSYFLTVDKNYELSVEKITERGFEASGGETMKRYIFHVFDDGSEQLVDIGGEAPAEGANTPEGKAPSAGFNSANTIISSAKIYQTLMVLDYIRLNKDRYKKPDGEPDAENALRAGIKYAAEKCGLPTSTIMDKFLRQMGTNIQKWRNFVSEWLKTGDFSSIKEFLKEQIDGPDDAREDDSCSEKRRSARKRSDSAREGDRAALACFVKAL